MSMRYLIVTYRSSVAPNHFHSGSDWECSDFARIHLEDLESAVRALTAVLVLAAQEIQYGDRETYLYVNGFGPEGRYCEDRETQAGTVSPEEAEALHNLAVVWSVATERAEIEIRARAEKAATEKAAREKAQAEQARASAAQEIERLKKLHGLT